MSYISFSIGQLPLAVFLSVLELSDKEVFPHHTRTLAVCAVIFPLPVVVVSICVVILSCSMFVIELIVSLIDISVCILHSPLTMIETVLEIPCVCGVIFLTVLS